MCRYVWCVDTRGVYVWCELWCVCVGLCVAVLCLHSTVQLRRRVGMGGARGVRVHADIRARIQLGVGVPRGSLAARHDTQSRGELCVQSTEHGVRRPIAMYTMADLGRYVHTCRVRPRHTPTGRRLRGRMHQRCRLTSDPPSHAAALPQGSGQLYSVNRGSWLCGTCGPSQYLQGPASHRGV